MSKIAFVFPGQGSQTVGMCKAFYDEYPVVKQIFEEADDALGYSISLSLIHISEPTRP